MARIQLIHWWIYWRRTIRTFENVEDNGSRSQFKLFWWQAVSSMTPPVQRASNHHIDEALSASKELWKTFWLLGKFVWSSGGVLLSCLLCGRFCFTLEIRVFFFWDASQCCTHQLLQLGSSTTMARVISSSCPKLRAFWLYALLFQWRKCKPAWHLDRIVIFGWVLHHK